MAGSATAIARVLLGLRKDLKHLTPEQRSGAILAAVLKDITQPTRRKSHLALSRREVSKISSEISILAKSAPQSTEVSENGLGTLLLLSRALKPTGAISEFASTTAKLLSNESFSSPELLRWGLSILQNSGETSYDSEVFAASTKLLLDPLTEVDFVKELLQTINQIPTGTNRQVLLESVIPSVLERFHDVPTVVQELISLLDRFDGDVVDRLRWRISSNNLHLGKAESAVVELMTKTPELGVPIEEYSRIARQVLSGRSPAVKSEVARRWASAGVPFEVDVSADLARRLLDQGNPVLIYKILSGATEPDRVNLLKQLLLWTSTDDHRFAVTIAPLIETVLSSESSVTNAALQELVEFIGKLESVHPTVIDAVKRAILDSRRSEPPETVLDFIEQRILRGDDFLSLSTRDYLERELAYFSSILEIRARESSSTNSSVMESANQQRVSFLSRIYQSSLSDSALMTKCRTLLDSMQIAPDSHAETAIVLDALKQLLSTTGPRPVPITQTMSLGELRATEWSLLCLSKGRYLLKRLQQEGRGLKMGEARDVYVKARLALDHPLTSNLAVQAAVRAVHAAFRSVDDSDPEEFHDNLDWMLKNKTLAWDSPSAGLHSAAIAGMCKNGLKFNDVTVARKMSEYVNRKVLEPALALPAVGVSSSSTATMLPHLTKEHALFVIAKACQFLQNDVVEFDEGCAQRASSLMEWFCSDQESNLFSSLCATIESSTRDNDALLAQVGLSAIRDCLVMEYLDVHSARRSLYETMRKRLADVVLSTAEQFPIDQGYFAVLLAGLSACASFQAAEPNALWTDQGTRIPLLAAQQLKRKEKTQVRNDLTPTTLTTTSNGISEEEADVLKELFVDYTDQDNSGPAEISSTVAPWIIHCGLVASTFRSPSMISTSAKRKDMLSPSAKNNIGNALLTFLSLNVVREHPDKTLVPCINALASFAGRSSSEWTRIDMKILLKSLRLAEKNREITAPVLGIMREYARRPAIGKLRLAGTNLPPSSSSKKKPSSPHQQQLKKAPSPSGAVTTAAASYVEPKTHPLVDRVMDLVLTALPQLPSPKEPPLDKFTVLESVALKPLDPIACVNGFKTVSGLLENLSDASAYQQRLYQKGFVKTCIASLVPFIVAKGPEEVAEAACLALQNIVAFQPRITAEICKRSVEVIRGNANLPTEFIVLEPFEPLSLMLFNVRLKDNSKLTTATIGAYFALLQADPEASLEVTKLIREDYPLLARVVDLREAHAGDPVLRETAEALAEFLKKQYVFLQMK